MKPARAFLQVVLSVFLLTALVVSSGFAATKKLDRHRLASEEWNDSPLMSATLLSTGSSVPSDGGPASLSIGSLESPSLVLSPGTPDNWGGGTGNWSNGGNWSAGAPGAGSDVTIYSGGNDTVTLDTSPTISSLTLGGTSNGTTSELTDGGLAQTLTITNGLTVGQTGYLQLTGGSTITVGTDLNNAGQIDMINGSHLSIAGNLNNQNSGGYPPYIYVFTGAVLSVTGNFDNQGSVETGAIGGGSQINVTGTLTNEAGAALQIYGSGDSASIGKLVNNGFFYIDSGPTQATTAGSVTDAATGVIDLENGSKLTVYGAVDNTGSIYTSLNGGTGNNILTIAGTLTNYGTFELLGPGDMATIGSNAANSATFSLGGNGDMVTIAGSLTNRGAFELNGSGDMSTMTGLSNSGFVGVENAGTLQINGDATNSGELVTSNFGTGGSVVNINGTLTNSGTFELNGPKDMGTIGSLANENGAFVDVEGGSTLTIKGDVTNGIPIGGQGGIFTGYNGTGGNTLNIAGALANGGTFELNGPKDVATVGGNVINNGSLQLLGGPGSMLTVSGNLNNSAFVDLEGGSTLQINGDVNNSSEFFASKYTNVGGNKVIISGMLTNGSPSEAFFVLFGFQDTAIIGSVTNVNGGLVDVEASTLQIKGDVANSGWLATARFGYGFENTLSIGGVLTNYAGGRFGLYGWQDKATLGGLVNEVSGTVDVEGGSTLQINGDATNSGIMTTDLNGKGTNNTLIINGTLTNQGGVLTLTSGDMATIGGDLINLGGVNVNNGSTLQISGNASNDGQFTTGSNGGDNKVTIAGNLTNGHPGHQITLLGDGDTFTVVGTLEGPIAFDNYGAFTQFNTSKATIDGLVWNEAGARIDLEGPGSVFHAAGDVDNWGLITTDFNGLSRGGNKLNIDGNLANSGTFQLNAPNDMATIGGNVTNNGSFQLLGNGSTATIGGDMSVGIGGGTGSLTITNGSALTNQNGFVGTGAGSSGTALVSTGSSWTNLGNLSVGINGGSGLVVVNNGGTVTAQVLTIGPGGEVDPKGGTLIYTSLLNSGTLDPVGTANLIGNFLTVFPQGRILLDVIGSAPGQYGQLDIKGSALLSGLTVIDFMNGFAPKKGDVFDLINITGSFNVSNNTIEIEGLQPGFDYSVDFANGEYTLVALNDGVPAPEPATLLVLLPGLLGAGYGLRRKLLM